MTKLRHLTGLVVAASVIWTAPARANVVSDWNGITTQIVALGDPTTMPVTLPARGGPPGLFDIALVHLAIHDAVQAIEGRYQPYYYSTPGSGSVDAAVAAAAHRVLALLYPAKQGMLDTTYNNYLTTNGINPMDPGIGVGEAAAAALHANHYRPVIAVPNFFGSTEIGQWRSAVPMAFLYMAVSTPFTLNRTSQFRPPPPPPMQSVTYFREYEEVKALGRDSAHPNSQTNFARFWSGNFFEQWNDVLRQMATNNSLGVGDSARLFALANTTAADTAMAVWESKYFYNFWRPTTAIQEGDNDPNARTAGDVTWAPLLADPPYSDYVSGANGVTGAFTGALRLFFGTDEMSFTVKSIPTQMGNEERTFTTFSQAAQEVVEARILLGIHFRSADEEARRLGNRVAHWAFQKFLRPVPGSK
jgi:PAP2 superfamily